MPDHKNLHTALAAVQGALETLPKDGTNPAFGGTKFTPLDTIVETVGPLLSEHGLTFTAWPTYGADGKPALRYKLAHGASGEFDEDTMPLLNAKQDPQGMGGGITYARRYALSAVLNIVSDDDDDGNTASRPGAAAPAKVGLGEADVKIVLDAIREAHMPPAWHRLKLTELGVKSVPETLTKGVIAQLDPMVALKFVGICGDAVRAREDAETRV